MSHGGGPRPIEDLDPLLREAVDAGLMTIEEAWGVDDFGSEMATAIGAGELTRERAHAITEERATRHALRRGKA